LHKGIIDFKKGYQSGTNIIKNEKGDMVTDSHSILARWRNHFSLLMNVHGVNDVRQTDIHRELLVPEIEMAIEKLERHKSPGVDPQQSGLKQEVGQFVLRSLNINSIWNKEELPRGVEGVYHCTYL